MIRQTCCFVLFEWTNQICRQVRAKGFPAMPDATAPWRVAINETLAKASRGWKNGYLLSRKTLKCIVVSISVTVYKSCCFFLSDLLLAQCTAQGYCTVWPKKKNANPCVPTTGWCMRSSSSSLSCPPGWKRCQWRHHGCGESERRCNSPGCSALKTRHSLKLHQDSGQNSHAFFLPYLVPLVPTQNPMPLSCSIPARNSRKLIH